MALREFTDERGRRWRVWDIVPDQLHSSTRLEDYMQGFLDGWLAFETLDGAERARLTPFPTHWAEAGDEELRTLLARAERPHRRERSSGASTDARASGATGELITGEPINDTESSGVWSGDSWRALSALPAERGPSAPPGTIRTFRYPGGRFWSVYEYVIELPVSGAPGALRPRLVLRFTSGMRSLDLLAWPAEWFTHSDEELAELLWRAFPRDPFAPVAGPLRRRRSDRSAPV